MASSVQFCRKALDVPLYRRSLVTDGDERLSDLGFRQLAIGRQVEKTVVLNEQGFAIHTETRGLLRALIDGVTGYTTFYTNRGNSEPDRLHVIQGGTPGRYRQDPVVGDTAALNINFAEPLGLGRSLRLHWIMHLPPPPPGASPETGWAEVADIQTRNLTLRAQFDDGRLPVRPLCYVARPRVLLRPLTLLQPLELQPGNIVSYTWPQTEEGKAYTLQWQWQWPEHYKTAELELIARRVKLKASTDPETMREKLC